MSPDRANNNTGGKSLTNQTPVEGVEATAGEGAAQASNLLLKRALDQFPFVHFFENLIQYRRNQIRRHVLRPQLPPNSMRTEAAVPQQGGRRMLGEAAVIEKMCLFEAANYGSKPLISGKLPLQDAAEAP